jgi:hypothetical protein
MRDMVIKECEKLLAEVGEDVAMYKWDMYSNKELLGLYGNLRIEIETEEYGDDDNNGSF